MDVICEAHGDDIQMIDSTSVRVHQQGSNIKKGDPMAIIVWAEVEEV